MYAHNWVPIFHHLHASTTHKTHSPTINQIPLPTIFPLNSHPLSSLFPIPDLLLKSPKQPAVTAGCSPAAGEDQPPPYIAGDSLLSTTQYPVHGTTTRDSAPLHHRCHSGHSLVLSSRRRLRLWPYHHPVLLSTPAPAQTLFPYHCRCHSFHHQRVSPHHYRSRHSSWVWWASFVMGILIAAFILVVGLGWFVIIRRCCLPCCPWDW